MKFFKPTNWSIDRKVPIYLMTIVITLMGIVSYIQIPKEETPEIVIPTIIVQTIHPGTSSTDIENLITRPIEKQLKSVGGVKKVVSNSLPDVSVITVEFNTDLTPVVAKQRVQDAVDKSRSDLPNDLDREPVVQEIDFSEFPIMSINIYGNLEPARLKVYAEELRDKIETFKEITRCDIIGAPEREIQINLDLYKMQASGVSFSDVEFAVKAENVNISGGDFVSAGVRRNIRVASQFKSSDDMKNIVIKATKGGSIYLRDIAEIKDDFKEQQNFARLDGKSVISLSVIKKSGENLISASDKIQEYVKEFEKDRLPQNVKISITADMSDSTRKSLADLINTVILGFIFVTVVLMFFMGVQDSLFIALAAPISFFMAFVIMPTMDYTLNMVVMFSLLLALGIIVDDAIVVIENTHRMYTKEKMEISLAAKTAAGEVFIPVFTGTLTTLAPFFPLLFWPGIVGKFMIFLPVILIITLTASLIVAFIINPVLAVEFMAKEHKGGARLKRLNIFALILGAFAVLFYLAGFIVGGNIASAIIILAYVNKFILHPLIELFQSKIQPKIMSSYRKTLDWALKGKRPYGIIGSMFVLFILTIMLLTVAAPPVNFFPDGDPNFVYVYIETPFGTDATVTDSITKNIEHKIDGIVGKNNPAIKSILSNVGIGAGDPYNPDRTETPHKGKITLAFKKFNERNGVSTRKILEDIQKNVKSLPGVEVRAEKEQNGPPTGKPISIEISGDKLETLTKIEADIRKGIADAGIQGIDKLKSDMQMNKPEIIIEVDRQKNTREGISSADIGMSLRSAVFGKEISKFRDDKDEYPIQMRLDTAYRHNLNAILNMPITFREMSTGMFRQAPVSSLTKTTYTSTYAGINRKNQKRTITLGSTVGTGYNANEIRAQIEQLTSRMDIPKGYEIKLTGEEEDQMEAGMFLVKSFFIAIFLILIVLVTQFNSMTKSLIILVQVLLSTIGVFLGFLIFRFTISVVLTGVGIVALAGIVVKNGIVLLDFVEILREKGGRIRTVIAESGAIRFNPVMLTAAATVLGLVPLAIGLNFDFITLFTHFDPEFFIGGDTAAFWGPLAWAIIFGLTFATFLTLIVVPCMYFIQHAYTVKSTRKKMLKKRRDKAIAEFTAITLD